MRCFTLASLAAALVTLSACGDSRPPAPAPGPGGSETIRGTERLGWDQLAGTLAELATFRYAIYVDGNRSEMNDVTCGSSSSAAGFACSGRLPALTPGQHALELASFVVEGGSVLESARSAPLRVNVVPALTAPASGTAVRRGEPASGAQTAGVVATVVSDAFHDITDIAAARLHVFVAERRGAVRIIDNGALNPRPALLVPDSIVSLAADPEFERSRLIFVLHAGAGRSDDVVLRLVRYREVAGTLGERAVILDNIPVAADDPRGVVRFGPDGKVYVASTRAATDAAGARADQGQMLRLERDGTTPADQQAFDPVHAAGPVAFDALDWQPRTSGVWLAERAGALERLALVPGEALRARQGFRDAEQRFVPGTRITSMHFYRGDRIRSLQGALLAGSNMGLLAVRFDWRQPERVAGVDTLLDVPIRAVTADADGRVLAATENSVVHVELARR